MISLPNGWLIPYPSPLLTHIHLDPILIQIKHVLVERDILTATKTPWLVSLLYAFQDPEHIYLAMVRPASLPACCFFSRHLDVMPGNI